MDLRGIGRIIPLQRPGSCSGRRTWRKPPGRCIETYINMKLGEFCEFDKSLFLFGVYLIRNQDTFYGTTSDLVSAKCVICQMRFTHRGLPPRTCRYDTSRRPKTLQQMNCQFTAAPPIPTLSQSFLLRNYPSSWISVPTLDTIGCAFSYTLEGFHLILEDLGIPTFRFSACQKPPIRHRIRLVL